MTEKTTQGAAGSGKADQWIDAIQWVAKSFGLHASPEALRHHLAWVHAEGGKGSLRRVLRQAGLEGDMAVLKAGQIKPEHCPAIVELRGGGAAVVMAVDGDLLQVRETLTDEEPRVVERETLEGRAAGRVLLLRPARRMRDTRLSSLLAPYRQSWLFQFLRQEWRAFAEIGLGAFVAAVLAIATALFSMQVYDRVLPTQSMPTLVVLGVGVVVAILLEFVLRLARTVVADVSAKRLDMAMSTLFFARALDVRNDERPRATGTVISQLRELEQVRALLTSTTVMAVADLPFVLFFLWVVWLVGGPLVLVALAVVVGVVVLGLLAQVPMAQLAREGMREGALRNSLLVESVQGIEDIKALQANTRFLRQWEQCNGTMAKHSMRQRLLAAGVSGMTQTLQQLAYVGVIVFGAMLVFAGEATSGAMLAASILTQRAIGPLAHLAQIFTSWQHAKAAREGLDALLRLRTDHGAENEYLHRPVLAGHYVFRKVSYKYAGLDAPTVLNVDRLEIKAGERVTILGPIGAGKSTLLRLLCGASLPSDGVLTLDGTDVRMIDPGDLRRDVGFAAQNARLFHGTVRDNLLLGAPYATEERMLEALTVSGAIGFLGGNARGLDAQIEEGGSGLSVGQRQMLLLARLLVRNPKVVVLDEPSAWLDEHTEQGFIDRLGAWLGGRTLIVATHRLPILRLTPRVVVLAEGQVVMDGTREAVLERLRGGPTATVVKAV